MENAKKLATVRIRDHEGLRLRVYDDADGEDIIPGRTVIGHPTIGYGRALDVRGISHEEAEMLLKNDVEAAFKDVSSLFFSDELAAAGDARVSVLIEMAFNLGKGGLARFIKFIDAFRKKDFDRAAAEMLDSRWAKQIKSRAQTLAEIMRRG